jgi:hypothetical protein
LDFDLTLGTVAIHIPPDFIGWILVIVGLREIKKISVYFGKVIIPSIFLAVYTGILDLKNVLAIATGDSLLDFIFSVIVVIGSFYVLYYIIKGVLDIEQNRQISLKGEILDSRWMLMLIFYIVGIIFSIIPFVVIIAIVAMLVVNIMFLVAFYKTQKLFYQAQIN